MAKAWAISQSGFTENEASGGTVEEKPEIYVFKLTDTEEIYEVEAEDSAEALRRCLREKKWPLEKIVYFSKKKITNPHKAKEGADWEGI